MRAFVGIPLPSEVRRALVAARAAFVEKDASWRDMKWVAEENLHITLKFLGDVSAEGADTLAADVAQTTLGGETLRVRLTDVQAVPTLRRARMLWGVFADESGGLTSLSRIVDRAATSIGVEPDTRPYTAHATLCRARRPQAASPGGVAAATEAMCSVLGKDPFMSVRQAIVYESTLTRTGPIYAEHARIDIGPGD